jgi:transcriptional regulator with XRE-family HTH domain
MTRFLDTKALAERLKAKRGKRGLREISEEMNGIGISTLSRIENGKVPDVETFLTICHWLQVSPGEFIKKPDGDTTIDSIDEVEGHFRADRNLDPELEHALAAFMLRAYAAAIEETPDEE